LVIVGEVGSYRYYTTALVVAAAVVVLKCCSSNIYVTPAINSMQAVPRAV
jgi:hypothetical protein